MPPGGRKRKASKKKAKNWDAHNSNDNYNSNSSSAHSQGSDDPKTFDDRESDSGEVEREEGEAVDYEEGGYENGKDLSEEIVQITKDTIADVLGEGKHEENGSGDVDCSVVDMANESPIGVLTSEDSLPSNGDVQDKELAIEEEKSMVAESDELKGQDVPSVVESIPGDEIPNLVDSVSQEANGVLGASLELVKDVLYLPHEINAGFQSLMTSDVVDSESMQNADTALQISDEKDKFSSVMDALEAVETTLTSMDEDKRLVGLSVDASSGEDAAKVLETIKHVEEVIAPAVTTTQMVESVENGETIEQSDDMVSSTVVTTNCEVDSVKEMEAQKQSTVEGVENGETLEQSDDSDDLVSSTVVTTSSNVDSVKEMEAQKHLTVESVENGENLKQSHDVVSSTVVTTGSKVDNVKEMETQKQLMVESVENGETLKQSDDQVGSTAVTTGCEVDNVKEMLTQKRSMDKPLIGSNPLPVRRTSWMGCCGLVELFSGANR